MLDGLLNSLTNKLFEINSRGQLGNGDIEGRDEPEEVVSLSGLNIICIAAGGWHTCAVTSSGDLYTWGWNHHGQLGISKAGVNVYYI